MLNTTEVNRDVERWWCSPCDETEVPVGFDSGPTMVSPIRSYSAATIVINGDQVVRLDKLTDLGPLLS